MECLLIQAAEMMNNAVETVMCTAEQVMCKAEVLFRAVVPVSQCMSRPGRNRNRELGCVEVPGMSNTYYLSLSPEPCAADNNDDEEEDKPVWHSLRQGWHSLRQGWHSLDTAFLDAHLRTLEAQGEDTRERRMWLERDRLGDYARYLEESAAPSSPSVPLLPMPLLEEMDQVVTPAVPKASPLVPGAPLVLVCPQESVRPLKRTCLLTRFAEAAQAESLLGKRRRRASAAEEEPLRKMRSKRPTKMPARYNDFL